MLVGMNHPGGGAYWLGVGLSNYLKTLAGAGGVSIVS